ncbi:hypothetical protein CSHISOI_07456 [Colletotrichum shisoi]|uniref:Uncharacterized protein n=1 Tax=Colletotrichum shisoi TaxID=2078593 RepID=A0A5Q4BNG9_9PEZI|nr:hypothetical protein CSHISOI_07456 [Colletotrichum shisoi]
MKETRHARS